MNLRKWLSQPSRPSLFEIKKAERNLFARRALISFLGVLGLSTILFTNLYHLQVTNFDGYQTRSNGNRIKLLPLPPTRGLIYDRYGKLLAEKPYFFLVFILYLRK